jgi:hypothetical protein
MCYICCMMSSDCIASGAQGGEVPYARVWGQRPRNFFSYLRKRVTYLGGFLAHGFLPMVFYFRLRN